MMSIPAVRGFEMDTGMTAASMYGSHHNDPFTLDTVTPTTMPTTEMKNDTITHNRGYSTSTNVNKS